MQQCGFCSMVSGLLRRAMCVSSRRGSTESYYRELGDQDTLKLEDKSSDVSHVSEAINEQPRQPTDNSAEFINMTKKNLCTGRFLTMHKRRKKRLLTRSLYYESALLDDLQNGQVQCILERSFLWNFNAFTLENVTGGRCLPVLCVHLFQMYGLLSYFKLDVAKAWKLFSLIEEGYHSTNPYHNSVHAADVTQAMHCFLQQEQILAYLEPLEIMASLLAAIAHDMDHPGVNQPFLVATSNHLAALYKNTSVLENHHWRAAVSCLIESGLVDQMQGIQKQLVRQISSLILATDITRQQEYLSQFKNYLDTKTLDMTKSDHRHLVLQIALKCADISNPCRPWEISRKWSLKVCEEFFRQGDYERRLRLPVTALCDRHTTSIPKIQTGFFKFVVTPLITEWDRFLRNDLSTQMLENLLYNQTKWEILVAKEIAEETKTEISDAELVDDDLETCSGTNISDSSELLLPLRRGSLNQTKQIGLKEQLRRFSVPLNVFQDTKFKNREKNISSSVAESRSRGDDSMTGSGESLHSQLSVRGHCEHKHYVTEKVLSTEKLLPDSSIASITTPLQATRLNTVIKDASWKLVRQQTFPPLEMTTHEYALAVRPLYTSNEDVIYSSRYTKPEIGQKVDSNIPEGKISIIFQENDNDMTSNNDTSKFNLNLSKENNEPSVHGSGLHELLPIENKLWLNLTKVQLNNFSGEQHQHRRKSMPSDTVLYTPKEKKMRDVTAAIPEILCRTLSGKDSWPCRRGSAPAQVVASETRGLAALAHVRQSANGSRRKVNPAAVSCQWFTSASSTHQTPRRGSLPAEVLHATETMKQSKTT